MAQIGLVGFMQKTLPVAVIFMQTIRYEVITEIEEDTVIIEEKISKYYPLRFTSEMMSLMHLQ